MKNEHRAKDFLTIDVAHFIDTSEYCWFDKVGADVTGKPTTDECVTFLLTNVQESRDVCRLYGVRLGPEVGLVLRR